MPRSQTRPKRKASRVTVSAKPRSRKAGASQGFQASSLSYEKDKTQFANYQQLGLLADANQIGAAKRGNFVTGFHPRVKGPTAEPGDASELHPLEIEMPPAKITIRKVPVGERAVLTKLLARHGDDCQAMARDMRLNALQHTAAHLRHRIAKMREEDEEDAEEARKALAAGNAPPPPRLRKKLTRDPNPAFKKRSKHFN